MDFRGLCVRWAYLGAFFMTKYFNQIKGDGSVAKFKKVDSWVEFSTSFKQLFPWGIRNVVFDFQTSQQNPNLQFAIND